MMKPFVADVHMHSLLSGHAFGTVRELAFEAAARQLKLIGVTEHGPGIPGTCDPILFRNFIDAPRNLYGVEMLYGSEVNVLNTGTVDLDRRHLNCLDYAVAGIHGLCYEDEGVVKNTDNVIRCMAIDKVKFISHPDSDSYPVDYRALVQGAKEYATALEVNNSSLRKPALRPGCVANYEKMLPLCMEYGVNIIVNTDSHDPSQVGDFTLARALLQRLEMDEDLILNNDLEKLKAFLLA
ncbi:MAG: phosphatase [Oscillospiraceae bacterium]|nr:phosphatase [Oscillospiraceae bacterium]